MKNKILAFLLATTMICTGFTTATPVFADSSTKVTVTKTTPAVDTEAPTGSISIADNKWSEFLSSITFGKIFKEKKTVTIDSHDNVAVASVKYYVSNTALSLAEVQNIADADWNTYENGFSLKPVSKYVVYALITDTSGNKTYISSDGLVFISESAPNLSVTDITQTSFKAGINLDENTLDAVSEAGVKYRKKGDTNWTTVTVSDLKAENTISVDDLQAGTEYEIVSFVKYTDGTSYESESSNVQTEATQLPQGKITVSVKNSTGETKSATISIVRGNDEIAAIKVKDISGDGSSVDSEEFKNLPDGIYNIVIKTDDGKFTDTKMIEIKNGESSPVEFEIVKGELTNVVDVKENTPAVAVDGISDAVNNNEHVVSNEEKEQIEKGEISIELRFEVEKKDEKTAEGAGEINKLAEENGVQVDTFLDMSLMKVTKVISGSGEGSTSTTNVGSVNNQIFKIAVPYETKNVENIKVIRYHAGKVQELEKLDAMPADTELKDGTYFIGDGYIYIFASGFSTYAIAKKDNRAENTNVPSESGIVATMPTGADKADAKISGVDSSMEYSTDNGINWTQVTGNEITGLSSGKVLIRYAGTDTIKPSKSTEITVPEYVAPEKNDGPAAPDKTKLTVTTPTSKDAVDGKISGVNESMEYSTDGGNTWKDVTGTEITGLAGGSDVVIRIKETDDTKPGEQLTIHVDEFTKDAGPEAPDSTKITATAPTGEDAADGKISGVDSSMEYSTDNGKTWTKVTGNEITGLTSGKVLIRVAETDTAEAGDAAEIVVPEYVAPQPGKEDGPAAPDVSKLTVTAPTSKDTADGKITGVDSSMEYSTDGGKTWKDVTGTEITGIAGGTNVIIRVKETDTANAGEQLTVFVKEYVAPAEKPEKPADDTKKPEKPATSEKKAGKTVDSSKVKATAPTSKTATDGKITGVDSTMEYSTDGGKTWIAVTGTEIANLSAGEVWIRVKETSDTAAGEILKVTVPAYSAQVTTTPIKKTGDNNSYVFWLITLAAAALCIGTGVRRSRRK